MIMVDAEQTQGILREKFGQQGVQVSAEGLHDVTLRAVVEGTTLEDARHFFEEALRNAGVNMRRVSYRTCGVSVDNGLQQVCIDMR
ncbi:MAG: hypothetical protein H6861_07255 [Rhodospirillales bacterium]|nr:hypothetical protein [Rhodospirillales bacterium]